MKNFINKEKMIPSKEDILAKHCGNYRKYQERDYGSEFNVSINGFEAKNSMDEWAKHRSISFARWLSGEGYQQYDEADRWVCPSNNNNVYTTEQLYNQYLKSCSKT